MRTKQLTKCFEALQKAEGEALNPVELVKAPLPPPHTSLPPPHSCSNLVLTLPMWYFCCGSLMLHVVTVELQWLEQLENNKNMFETWVARANEC